SLPGWLIVSDWVSRRLGGGSTVLPSPSPPAQVASPVDTAVSAQAAGPTLLGLVSKATNLLTTPWRLTFHADQLTLPVIGAGEIGVILLLLLPLVLFAPRTRATALLAVTVLLSAAAWWFTPLQLMRHLLPTLAIVCALAGAGLASVMAPGRLQP